MSFFGYIEWDEIIFIYYVFDNFAFSIRVGAALQWAMRVKVASKNSCSG